MEKEPDVPEITAEDVLRSLLETIRDDWTAYGTKLWIKRMLGEKE